MRCLYCRSSSHPEAYGPNTGSEESDPRRRDAPPKARYPGEQATTLKHVSQTLKRLDETVDVDDKKAQPLQLCWRVMRRSLVHNGRRMKPPIASASSVVIELNAVLVALTANQPLVLTLEDGTLLPSGPFESEHPTLQAGVRAWVERQTHHPLGYVEQLYTFADRNRVGAGARVVSISYLGLTRERLSAGARDPEWRNWYRYFPWEDWRSGAPSLLRESIVPQLAKWADTRERRERVEANFGDGRERWNEELVLQRYELLHEAGLIAEAGKPAVDAMTGMPMRHDHRRILATGIARLRAKIKYRPVVFELMPPQFTLLQLQRAVEALAGQNLHKQNFRRLIEQQGLVEETGAVSSDTGGRPAQLFRFRQSVLLERAVGGSKLPLSRST